MFISGGCDKSLVNAASSIETVVGVGYRFVGTSGIARE